MKNKESSEADTRRACDNAEDVCRATDIPPELARLSVPLAQRRSFNRCNLPPEALGSLAFQLAPVDVEIDGVMTLHGGLFRRLDRIAAAAERSAWFQGYMDAHFQLSRAEENGHSPRARKDRSRLDYLRLLRGWLFDPDGREAAVLKGWVESRFGLLTCHFRGPLEGENGAGRDRFEHLFAAGLYSTGALESQLDLLYGWSQYELRRRAEAQTHFRLYRGVTGAEARQPLARIDARTPVVQLNNLCSFTVSVDRADEFGDRVMCCEVPRQKVLAFSGLLPGRLQGEDEYLVIGGVYAVRWRL
jgi:NAD+---dinitrogen-reductase ADP-D-ribosyltransferase